MNSISVNEAIKKGRWQLFWIPILIFFGCMATTAAIMLTLPDGTTAIAICGFTGFGLTIAIPMLYYFKALPAWRIWAFTNVRNVHELRHIAKLRKIYPEDKSFLWRLEIKNAEQKRQIEELQQKFDQPDIFEDDYTVPYETTYSYSKVQNLFYLLFSLASAVTCAVFLTDRNIYPGIIMAACAVLLGYTTYKRYTTTGPVVTISNDGITTLKNGFHPWQEIQNEQIFYVSAGKNSYYGLSYDVNGNTIKMSLKELTGLSSYKIDHVLRTYRGRYQASHTSARSTVINTHPIGY